MKTQLLEDIGQSGALSPTPSQPAGSPAANGEVHKLAPAAKTVSARPRSALGVWREKTAAAPVVPAIEQPDPQPTPLELESVLEELAALEAQYVPPAGQAAAASAPAGADLELPTLPRERLHPPGTPPVASPTARHEPVHAPAIPPVGSTTARREPLPEPAVPPVTATLARREPLHEPAAPPVESATAPYPAQGGAALNDPLFDFTEPLPTRPAVEHFTRAPAAITPARRRYLFWGAGLLAIAMLVQGGRWLYQERNDAGSLARIAGEANAERQADQAVRPQVADAAPEPGADASVAPAAPASQSPSAVPPLVMLKPDPPAAARPGQASQAAADQAELETPLRSEPGADQEAASSLPEPASQAVRKPSVAAVKRAAKREEPNSEEPKRAERAPTRQLARVAAVAAEKPAPRETTMEATLRACREHGYHAAQCIKRQCGVTEYGFVCRGR